MPTNVLLISESVLRDSSFIGANVQDNALSSSIKTAQETVLKPILGKKLYDKIMADVAAAGSLSGLGPNYDYLVEDYCIPVILNAALNISIPKLMWKATNKGIVKSLDQYTEGIDLETIKYIRQEIKNEEEYHIKRLQMYLANNYILFPEYNQVLFDENPNQKIGYDNGGIYFRKKRNSNVRNPFLNGTIDDNPQFII